MTLERHTSAIFDIYKNSLTLLKNTDLMRKKVRLIGISVSGLKQNSDLDNVLLKEDEKKEEKLTGAIDKISKKFGDCKVFIAGVKDFVE
jgi:hypothetical protein